MNNFSLDFDALVRSIGINRESPHALFLGAGASISSGIPSAGKCIWEWKKSIFCTNNPGLEEQVEELSLPAVQQRINRWLQVNNYIPGNDIDEYCFYIEKCLPIAEDRRRFFEQWIRTARPHIGYKILCLLAESELIQSVWTTNFDSLVSRAAADFDLTSIEIGIDCQDRVYRQPAKGELISYSLHGDYRYDLLKNTKQELQVQEDTLKNQLVSSLKTDSLIVSGYSGRDESIMAALSEALSVRNASGKFFWCGYSKNMPETVANLLKIARRHGREAYYVPGVSFDDLMIRLASHCLDNENRIFLKKIIGDSTTSDCPRRSTFRLSGNEPNTLVKSNCWEIHLPTEVFKFDLIQWPKEKVWKWLDNKSCGYNIVAVPMGSVMAFGTLDAITECFNGNIKGKIQRVPIIEKDLRYEDGAIINLLRRTFVQSIAEHRKLKTDGNTLVWLMKSFKIENIGVRSLEVFEAAKISLRRIDLKTYLTIEPTIHIPGASDNEMEEVRSIKMRILGYQHNKEYNEALRKWMTRLFTRGSKFDFPPKTAAFEYSVEKTPIFAGIYDASKSNSGLQEKYKKFIQHQGIRLQEPKLVFSGNSRKLIATDMMPLRGLAQHGPYDQKIMTDIFNEKINVSVIAPRRESPMVSNFLAEVNYSHLPSKGSKEEYLVKYPDFQSVFRTPIEMASVNSPLWCDLSEIDSQFDVKEGTLKLSRMIREAVASLASRGQNLILIYLPQRWKKWWGFETENESFDIHDFIKAFAAQRGVATQFLNEDTVQYPDKCRIWWWLSLALYAKAMRTPWVLEGLDPSSAYVGLGYSINRKAEKNQQIVLGCSHLYNAQGQGLQFRLNRIDNPIFYGRNPFLSFDDARNVGETIRDLFWKAHLKLPNRVVIHKLTPFLQSEQKGLKAGLTGVSEIELLEINYEPSLRYISSIEKAGELKESRFPINRGSVIQLSDYEALLWIHGSTEAVKKNWTYFQGKRRIPSPVVIRRYAGQSDLATLVNEILGLSKMDWNSGDLYGKLPATVQSSKYIARIASLLDTGDTASYDYRLLM